MALAWVLAAAPEASVRNPGVAQSLAERAVTLTAMADAGALDVLAAAQAANQDFDGAIRTADAALALRPTNSGAIATRRSEYQQRRAFTLPR